jgi:hypothetical protein
VAEIIQKYKLNKDAAVIVRKVEKVDLIQMGGVSLRHSEEKSDEVITTTHNVVHFESKS